MSRKPSEEKQQEFAALKCFFVHWMTHISPFPSLPLSHPSNPVNVLERFEKQLSFSQVLSGLKQAVNDCLEGTEDWDQSMIVRANESLARAGAPLLSEMLVTRSRLFRQILRRKKIRNDTEYYLVTAALSDTSTVRPSDELELMNTIQAAYEAKA